MLALLKSETAGTATIWAASLGLTVFWILNIFKEAYPGVKSTLNFYAPVGPLLGLFLVGLVVFLVTMLILTKTTAFTSKVSDKVTFWVFALAIVLFFLMVFPPFFEPIVGALSGK